MSELKIKLGVDLSGVDDAAAQIPEKIERAARKQRRPLRPVRVWNERAGKWEAGLDPQNPNVPGGPSNRRAPTPNAYPAPIGPMPSGIPSGPFVPSARAYNRPIGPGLPGMPGGVLYTGSDKWARTFTDNLLGALEKSVMRMVVPVHIFNRFTNFIIGGIMEMFQRAADISSASRVSGLNPEEVQRLAYAAKMSNVSVQDLYTALESGNIKLGNALMKGGEVAVALQRLGIGLDKIKDRSQNTSTILMRLAEMYEDANQRAQVASVGYSIFGDEFKKLLPLISRGRQEIQNFKNEATVMSNEEVIAIENTKRTWDKIWDIITVGSAKTLDAITGQSRKMNARVEDAVGASMGLVPEIGSGRSEYERMSKLSARKQLEEMFGIAGSPGEKGTFNTFGTRERGEDVNMWANRMTQSLTKLRGEANTPEARAKIDELLKELPAFLRERTAQPGLLTGQLPFASSLQSMGGGDILSAISANPMDEIARNTAATAANTERIANKETAPGSPKPTAILTK